MLSEAWGGLLEIHPDTPPQVALWKKSFDRAWADASGDPAAVEDPECEGVDLRWAYWYAPAPAGPDLGPAEAALTEHLRQRLHLPRLASTRAGELVALAADLLAEEALRSFDVWLTEYEVPVIQGAQRDRFREIARSALQERSLTQALHLVWQAVEGARNVVRRHGAGSRYSAAEYGLRRYERYATTPGVAAVASAVPEYAVQEYLTSQPLSAVVQTLFDSVLAVDPTALAITQLVDSLVASPPLQPPKSQ